MHPGQRFPGLAPIAAAEQVAVVVFHAPGGHVNGAVLVMTDDVIQHVIVAFTDVRPNLAPTAAQWIKAHFLAPPLSDSDADAQRKIATACCFRPDYQRRDRKRPKEQVLCWFAHTAPSAKLAPELRGFTGASSQE